MHFRFAPTVNSKIHIGNLFILLINSALSYQHQLSLILRIDDKRGVTHDVEQREAAQIIQLARLFNIRFDEVIYQSQRQHIYQEVYEKLKAAGCLQESCDAVYLKLTNYGYKYVDIIQGVRRTKNIQDNVIIYNSSEKSFYYNFKSVVDDMYTNVTRIIRGLDHTDNTFIQICMFDIISRVLGVTNNIQFGHVFLFLSASGHKISKSDTSSGDFSAVGLLNDFLPEVLVYYLLFYSQKAFSNILSTWKEKYTLSSTTYRKVSIESISRVQRKFLSYLDLARVCQYFKISTQNHYLFLQAIQPYISTIDDLSLALRHLDCLEGGQFAGSWRLSEISYNDINQIIGTRFGKEMIAYLTPAKILSLLK